MSELRLPDLDDAIRACTREGSVSLFCDCYLVPICKLRKYSKKWRERSNSLSGSVCLNYSSRNKREFRNEFPNEYLDGHKKWDLLIDSMKSHGWLRSHPLIIRVPTRKIWDGHHRLAIAFEIGIRDVPVRLKM